METTYKGVTTIISDKLLDPITNVKNKPKKSYKFDVVSLYYDGVYYFLQDIKPSPVKDGKPFEIQGVCYRGKWYQDTFYITEQFKDFLINNK